MLIIKGDENFKISVRNYFHDAVAKVQGAKDKLQAAIDDDALGARQFVKDKNGHNKPVTVKDAKGKTVKGADGKSEYIRDPKKFSDEIVKAIREAVNPDEMFKIPLARAKKHSDGFDPYGSAKSYRAKVLRLQHEVESVYYECIQAADKAIKALKDELGDDDTFKELKTTEMLFYVKDRHFIDVRAFDEFVDDSSAKRVESVQKLVGNEIGGSLSKFHDICRIGPTYADVCEVALGELKKEFTEEASKAEGGEDYDIDPDKIIERILDEVGGWLKSELEAVCVRLFAPNEEFNSVMSDTVPAIVERTMYSNHRSYGVLPRLQDAAKQFEEDLR